MPADRLDEASLLDEPARRRLIALLRLCASDATGEQAAAAQGIARMAQAHLWRWEAVIPSREGAIARLKHEAARAAQAAALARTKVFNPLPSHATQAAEILEGELIGLSARDRDFLESMVGWRGRPTERQGLWLASLWNRHIRAGDFI